MSFRPSLLWTVAPTGQTSSQGAFSQCMQGTGWWMRRRAGLVPWCSAGAVEVAVHPQPVHLPPRSTCSLPTTGMLFSAWQAMTQALQPRQVLEVDRHAPGVAGVRA